MSDIPSTLIPGFGDDFVTTLALSVADDEELDAIFDAVPYPLVQHWCPYCQKLIVDEEDAFWILDDPQHDHYTAFCNQFHHDAYKKKGVFAEEHIAPLSLD